MKPKARVYWDTAEQKWCMSFRTPTSRGRSWFDLWRDACCAACLITRQESASACLRFWKGYEPPFDEEAPFQTSTMIFKQEALRVRI